MGRPAPGQRVPPSTCAQGGDLAEGAALRGELRSGNDAALAVAEHCGGSVEEFVGRMNEKAAQLGMVNSHFANPNG